MATIIENLDQARENRTSDRVCGGCGVQFLSKEQIEGGGGVHTAYIDDCGICGNKGLTLPIRHYNNLYRPNE